MAASSRKFATRVKDRGTFDARLAALAPTGLRESVDFIRTHRVTDGTSVVRTSVASLRRNGATACIPSDFIRPHAGHRRRSTSRPARR